jgi:hypothetical protein
MSLVAVCSDLIRVIIGGLMCACLLLRACSFVPNWWVGTIPNRITSLIYINFD